MFRIRCGMFVERLFDNRGRNSPGTQVSLKQPPAGGRAQLRIVDKRRGKLRIVDEMQFTEMLDDTSDDPRFELFFQQRGANLALAAKTAADQSQRLLLCQIEFLQRD